MKAKYKSLISNRILVLLAILVLFASCSKDSDNSIQHSYLIEHEKLYTIDTSFILATLNTLISVEPNVIKLIDNTSFNVDVYSISYKTKYKDDEITASGLICVPVANEALPILSFQNGTNTAHANAPSADWANPMFILLQSLAGNGYIILIPDYIGFGASKDKLHPYHVKKPTNSAVTDMMYAARELVEHYASGTSYSDEYFLMGYSQGGWATLSALEEIEANHNSEFEVSATSCGAGAYNLMEVSDFILKLDTFPSPLYLPYYIYSHQQYESLTDPLDLFFQEPYTSRIPELFTGSYSNGYVNSNLTTSMADLLLPEFITDFSDSPVYEAFRTDLKNNSVEAWNANSLINFYHGTADKDVPIGQSQNIYSDFVDLGLAATVNYIELEDKDHGSGVLPWGINTIIWFNEIRAE